MTKIAFSFLFVFFLFSCNKSSELKDFTYKYSMESVNNFKVEFQVNSDSTFKISEFNYFFDNYEGKKRPQYKEGKLTDEEFNTFKNLINGSRLEKMKDSYGFDNPTKESSIVYMIQLDRDGKSKYVSVNANTHEKFPEDFTELIAYTNKFINAHK